MGNVPSPGSFHHGICKVVEINNNVHQKKNPYKILTKSSLEKNTPHYGWGSFLSTIVFIMGEGLLYTTTRGVLRCGSSHLES
jgi:hypothetical protein